MSMDFDSATFPTQHEDEEYDKEDYEREQELHQLLMTGLPDDMLEDSRDISSPELNYSGCSANNRGEQIWEQKGDWNDQDANNSPTNKVSYSAENPVHNGQNRGYNENGEHDQYKRDYLCKAEYEQTRDHEQQVESEPYLNGWNQNHRIHERQYTYKSKGYDFPCVETHERIVDEHYVSEKRYESDYCQPPISCSPSDYHGFVNGPVEEFHDRLEEMPEYPRSERDQAEHLQHFITNENAELYKVKYNPYPAAHPSRGPFETDEIQGTDNRLEQKFLDSGEGSTEAHRFAQLQILYNARGRKLEEMQHKQEECAREIRYLNHQLAMTKGEKEGIAISYQELQKLLQDAKEREVQLEGQIKALESRIQDLSASEEEALKNQKIAEAAMESMQQQLSELSRSESLTRAREQHENIVGALKEKHEEIILAMQQTLDTTSISLEEEKENSKRLEEQVKRLQREQEEAKVEKADIINGLTKSLEASQQQCRDLLQTGSMQEITQLRIQLQQVQSTRNISDNMNKALQEELTDLKEQITLYESAAKVNAIIKEVPEEVEVPLSDSYMGLCIKNENLKLPRLQSSSLMCQGDSDKTLCKDDVIRELKTELERSLSNIRAKRHQVAQLQNEMKESQRCIAELKGMLQNAEKLARNHEVRAISLEKQLETIGSAPEKALRDEVEQLRCETRALRIEIEGKQQEIEKLTSSEKQFKEANQELYNEMRQMIQDFEQDKQEAIDRCERIHRQLHEDSKCRLKQELMEQHELEKTQLTQFYKQQITQVNTQLEQLNQEMSGVQECYITVCKEKDSLESQLREEMSLKLTTTEQELKRTFLEELQESLNELHEKHETAMEATKQQWMREKETDIKLQVESQLELAKAQWQEEQQKVTEQAICAVETEWQLCLHMAVQQKTSKREEICQNKESIDREFYTCQELEAPLANLKLAMEQQAKEEKVVVVGKALQKLELELQKKHEDNVARQVEIALTKARERWLEELTNLPEYRANLHIEELKWERKHEEDVATQIAAVMRENEEKWKKYALEEIEKAGSSIKVAELQEKIDILERELELQKEEASAVIKTELAKVQAQWNKEKQEEINRIHELNENDYRTFLDEHRNKLNEVLKAAKEDFTRQRNELLAQKDAELNLCILEKQKEWSAHQEEQIKHVKQQYESELVAEIELYLRQISKHFVIKSETAYFRIEEYCNRIKPIPAQIDKVKGRLQKVCMKLVQEILETVHKEENKLDLQNALREIEKQHKEYKTEKEAQLRKLELSEFQLKQELDHLQYKLNTTTQQKEIKCDQVSGKQNLNPEYQPCEKQSNLQVKKLQQECQQLKEKLDKMGQQLQLTVDEHKIDVRHLKEEHERTIKLMQNEKDDLLKRLKENKSITIKTNSSLQQKWSSKNSSKLISTKGLEEIRHQYLRAVDKIREDMLCYIQESKVRAAEMIRAEVLRERQQTARKMRKYYLTCLHQLLADGGKNEGAEKRIMNAASKLAAIAKAIETPLPNRKRDKAEIHPAQLTKKSSEVPKVSDNNGGGPASTHMRGNQSKKSSSSEGRIRNFNVHDVHKQKGIPGISLKDASSLSDDAMSESKYPKATSVAHCQNSAKFLSHTSLGKAHIFSCIDSLSDRAPLQRTYRQNRLTPSEEFVHLQLACHQNSIPSSKHYSEEYICPEALTRASSDICETPERDEDNCVLNPEASNSCKMDTFNFRQTDRKDCHLDDYSIPIKCSKSSGTSTPLSSTNMQRKSVSMPNGTAQVCPSISSAASDISSLSDDENACFLKKIIPAISRLHTEQVQEVSETVPATNNRDQLGTRTETGILYLTKDCIQKKHPSSMPQNIGNVQHDSGFDSPFLNFH